MEDTVKLAQELARIAKENDLAEIEYRVGKDRLRLVLEAPAPSPGPMMFATGAPAPVAQAAAAAAAAEASAPKPSSRPTINTPLAGIFYRAPRPGAPPFAESGQEVSTGQTLCIIEAMKLMNEITAEMPCTIVAILVENGEVVEAGQALFEIAPRG